MQCKVTMQTIKIIQNIFTLERGAKERRRSKETRKGGLERFFRFRPPYQGCFKAEFRLEKSRLFPKSYGVTQATEGDVNFNPDYQVRRRQVRFRKFSSPTRNFSGSCEPHEATQNSHQFRVGFGVLLHLLVWAWPARPVCSTQPGIQPLHWVVGHHRLRRC